MEEQEAHVHRRDRESPWGVPGRAEAPHQAAGMLCCIALPACAACCHITAPPCPAPCRQPAADAEEQANPCICTPRQLAALAATLLNMLLDCFSAAEAAGGFVKTRDNRWAAGPGVGYWLKGSGGGGSRVGLESGTAGTSNAHLTFAPACGACRMHRSNLRMLMDKQLKQLFWKNAGGGW